MSRSERWNTDNEVKRRLKEISDERCGAGPVLYFENGKKYVDDSDSHISVVGMTGKGKSQCITLPFLREIINKGESFIVIDPKQECYNAVASYISEDCQNFCIDFRNPANSPDKWNPLKMAYQLFKSNNTNDNDIASSLLSELWNAVYPFLGNSDKFWTDAAVNYAKGLTYGLFETANASEISIDNVAIMMEQSELRFGSSTVIKNFFDYLPPKSLARRNLSTYTSGPNDTRGSIHSVANSGIEVFSRSRGLMKMLSEDTLDILNLDVDRQFALFIILPDETNVYDSLAGLLILQVSQHLIRVAHERNGKLPIRVNIILEELGSIGKSIPTLPNLMVAGRSRNMRMILILQSNSQLTDVYGKSKAETINSCIGITIGFSTNNWETLMEWSLRCGERQNIINGHVVKEPLITATQIASMPTGKALIFIDSKYKFVSNLPFYYDLYGVTNCINPIHHVIKSENSMITIDFVKFVSALKTNKINDQQLNLSSTDEFERMIRQIDKRILEHDLNELVNNE